MWVLLGETELFINFDRYPWLKSATISQISAVETTGANTGPYWPELDLDIEVDALIHPERYPLIARPHRPQVKKTGTKRSQSPKTQVRRGARTAKAMLLSIAVFGPLLAPSARAEYLYNPGQAAWDVRPQRAGIFSIEPRFFAFSTNTNFGADGVAARNVELNSWSRMQGEIALRYGINDKATVFARTAWGLIQSDHTTTTYSGSAFGFADQTVGGSYRLYQSKGSALTPHQKLRIDLQLLGDIPAYANPVTAANVPPFLGNGSLDLTAGPLLTWAFDATESQSWNLIGSLGYTWRSTSYSMALPWALGIRREVNNDTGLQFSLIGHGQISLQTDARTAIGDQLGQGNGAGGSAAINAINPMLVAADAQLGFRFGPAFSVAAFAGMPLFGQNIPQGLRFGMHLSVDIGNPQRKRPDQLSNQDYGRGNQGFVTYGLEAKVMRANDRLNLIKINKGANDGVEMGQLFDIFPVQANGKVDEAIARTQVTAVRAHEAALSVTEYFQEILIEEGYIARAAMP